MGARLRRLARDARGLTTVEYLILACLVAIACVAAWQTFGDEIRETVGSNTTAVTNMRTAAEAGSGR